MLSGQQFSRCHNYSLAAGFYCGEYCGGSHHSFSGSYIPLYQSHRRNSTAQIAEHLFNNSNLCAGQREMQLLTELWPKPGRRRHQRSTQPIAVGSPLSYRNMMREHLLKCQPLPGRMRSLHQQKRIGPYRWTMQYGESID